MSAEAVRVLLVDDVEENLLALEALLGRDGLVVHKASSANDALELLLSHDFALAILDVQMPGMDGFELAGLMQRSERTRRVPIIFLTAGGSDDQRRFKGYGAGAVDFLFKPIEPEILQSKVAVFCELYSQRQEVVRQRDELREAALRNSTLVQEIQTLNESLEQRVQDRTLQLLEANEQLQSFTYSVAHDFRQHLRGISINASIVLNDAADRLGEQRQNLERLRSVALLMSKMTDDLLTHARIRSEALRIVEVDLTELAKEAAESRLAMYSGSEVRVQPGLQACGDRTMLRIVLENLLDNAFKYSQYTEKPVVEVGQEAAGYFVRDNGAGFDMDYADKLFLPFERLHTGEDFEGTGIGLANVKRIVERHGGKVWAESKPNEGATFFFTLAKK